MRTNDRYEGHGWNKLGRYQYNLIEIDCVARLGRSGWERVVIKQVHSTYLASSVCHAMKSKRRHTLTPGNLLVLHFVLSQTFIPITYWAVHFIIYSKLWFQCGVGEAYSMDITIASTSYPPLLFPFSPEHFLPPISL